MLTYKEILKGTAKKTQISIVSLTISPAVDSLCKSARYFSIRKLFAQRSDHMLKSIPLRLNIQICIMNCVRINFRFLMLGTNITGKRSIKLVLASAGRVVYTGKNEEKLSRHTAVYYIKFITCIYMVFCCSFFFPVSNCCPLLVLVLSLSLRINSNS